MNTIHISLHFCWQIHWILNFKTIKIELFMKKAKEKKYITCACNGYSFNYFKKHTHPRPQAQYCMYTIFKYMINIIRYKIYIICHISPRISVLKYHDIDVPVLEPHISPQAFGPLAEILGHSGWYDTWIWCEF